MNCLLFDLAFACFVTICHLSKPLGLSCLVLPMANTAIWHNMVHLLPAIKDEISGGLDNVGFDDRVVCLDVLKPLTHCNSIFRPSQLSR